MKKTSRLRGWPRSWAFPDRLRRRRPQASGSTPAAAQPVTIHFFNAIIENVDWYESVIERFEAEHPGIKVEMEFQKDYDAALKVKFQTGDIPEIINGGSSQVYIDQGRFLDLSDMTGWWDRLVPGIKEVCTDYKTGKQFLSLQTPPALGCCITRTFTAPWALPPLKPTKSLQRIFWRSGSSSRMLRPFMWAARMPGCWGK